MKTLNMYDTQDSLRVIEMIRETETDRGNIVIKIITINSVGVVYVRAVDTSDKGLTAQGGYDVVPYKLNTSPQSSIIGTEYEPMANFGTDQRFEACAYARGWADAQRNVNHLSMVTPRYWT